EGPRILVRRRTHVQRRRHGHGQEWREFRQDNDLPLRSGDTDLPSRKPEGVALVDDPDRVVPAVAEWAERADFELRELLQQTPCKPLVDDDLGLPDRHEPTLAAV